jgi:hypothetical protein
VLEKLRDREKQLRSLVLRKILPLVEQEDELSENGDAVFRINFAFMETISFIYRSNFIHLYHPLFTFLTAP